MNFKKKFVSFLGLSAIFALSFSVLVSAQTTGSVNGNNVNVRTEANADSLVLAKYSIGQVVSILGQEGNYYKIDIDGNDYYISSEFVDVLKADGKINGTGVNVRQQPNTGAEVLGKVTKGETITAVSFTGDWLKVEYNGAVGYISAEFVDGAIIGALPEEDAPAIIAEEDYKPVETEQKAMALDSVYAVVSSNTGLRLRSEATTSSKVVTLIPSGAYIDVTASLGEWVQVSYAGNTGYVSAEFVELNYGQKPASSSSASGLGQQIIDYGKQFLGTPYKWAGNDLTKGVDCSGFVYNVFKNFGISLNRSSASMVNDGYRVTKDELQVGDLVLFDTTGVNDGGISHVGIYMGDGNFIHSSSSTRTWGVVISSLYDDYYIRTYVTARRVL